MLGEGSAQHFAEHPVFMLEVFSSGRGGMEWVKGD